MPTPRLRCGPPQTAIETYAAEQNGNYTGATADVLQQIEPTLADVSDADFTVQHRASRARYRIARRLEHRQRVLDPAPDRRLAALSVQHRRHGRLPARTAPGR